MPITSFLAVVGVTFGISGIGLLWGWSRRERQLRAELRRRDDPGRLRALLPQLDRHIDRLLEEYGPDTFAKPQLTLPPRGDKDARSYIHSVIELAAQRWEITLPPIELNVVPHEARSQFAAAFAEGSHEIMHVSHDTHLTTSETLAWRIYVDPRYLKDSSQTVHMVAHEVAHGVLARDGVALTDVEDDECLTEVATALIGFGQIMLDNQSRVHRGFNGRHFTWQVGAGGYLWAPELRHVLSRHAVLMRSSAAT